MKGNIPAAHGAFFHVQGTINESQSLFTFQCIVEILNLKVSFSSFFLLEKVTVTVEEDIWGEPIRAICLDLVTEVSHFFFKGTFDSSQAVSWGLEFAVWRTMMLFSENSVLLVTSVDLLS